MRKIILAHIIFLLTNTYIGNAQNTDSLTAPNRCRLNTVIISESVLWAGSLYFFYDLWYKDYPQSPFHVFNDNKEWLQMDKVGHATTAYSISMLGYQTYKWAGVAEKKAVWYGGGIGVAYESIIEILDGFSEGWGFSIGDEIADITGSGLFISQQLLWKKQRILFKRSFHRTDYPDYRPDILGKNYIEELNKDYNGLTFWLSANVSDFLGTSNKFPRWLNLAAGYGAEGMTGGFSNPDEYNGKPIPAFERYRQFYIAPDINFSAIKTKSRILKSIFFALNFIKVPSPAFELSKKGTKFHLIYF